MCDGRDDVLGSGCGIKKTVTIDTHRHACGRVNKCTCLPIIFSFEKYCIILKKVL